MTDDDTAAPVLDTRRAGLLLHPTSLPATGRGVLGQAARRFVDFLADGGFRVWQVLPLGPPHEGGSPYQTQSAHAGDTRLVDVEALIERGWLAATTPLDADATPWRVARQRFESGAEDGARADRERFEHETAAWLDDFALYRVIRAAQADAPWWEWPAELRDREPAALRAVTAELAEPLADQRFAQFLFDLQWRELRAHAASRGVRLFGDVPIFVAWDSADCWAAREQFLLGADGRPTVVAGVPPDYFSATGQRWGNPLFDWPRMAADDFGWWRQRLASQLRHFDVLRIDHFRGFAAHWEIPASERDAVNGRWVEGPGARLFERLTADLGVLPLVAEDLGVITDDVVALRERLGLPGMHVLQFAFGGDAANPYLPHNHRRNAVAYTGTHDNDTTLAWARVLDANAREHATRYLRCTADGLAQAVVDAVLASVAHWAVLPMQDLLGLGEGHRMNTPGTTRGNWNWRFDWAQVDETCARSWRARNALYGRC